MIMLEYRDRDTNDINCICSLSDFVQENNYDDLQKDIVKIKNSKVGDIVIKDHANIVRRIKWVLNNKNLLTINLPTLLKHF